MTEEQKKKRDWLNRAFYAEKKLNALLYKRERDKELARRVTAVYGGNDKGRTDSRENVTEMALIKLLGSDEEYSDYLKEYLSLRREIEAAISTLHEPITEAILIQRHINFMSMEKIAERMHYSTRQINRKYIDGLEKMSLNVIECHF